MTTIEFPQKAHLPIAFRVALSRGQAVTRQAKVKANHGDHGGQGFHERVTFEGTEVLVCGEGEQAIQTELLHGSIRPKDIKAKRQYQEEKNEEEDDTGRRAGGLLGRPRRPDGPGGDGAAAPPSRRVRWATGPRRPRNEKAIRRLRRGEEAPAPERGRAVVALEQVVRERRRVHPRGFVDARGGRRRDGGDAGQLGRRGSEEEEEEKDNSGRGSFAVHALYNHRPSDADGFASGASPGDDSGGSGGDMVANSSPALSDAMSNGSGSAASWLVYFPVWDEGVGGDGAGRPGGVLRPLVREGRGRPGDVLREGGGRDGDGGGGTVAPGSGTEVDADVTLSLEDIFGDDDDEAGGSAGEDVLGMSAAVGGPAPTDEPTDAPTYEPTAAPSDAPTDVPTAAPTDTPTHEPTLSPAEPGPYHTSSPQNYCGRPGLVQDDCANPAIGTCNDGDGRCPDGECSGGLDGGWMAFSWKPNAGLETCVI
ncbi:hypothetical protein THAOC_37011 [Thalassiosira oceanica]|uniref:Uncharacterized protein n=1 Tax=Thalassiosira oceanica TaxID=159749 RepID=K0R0V4_THAOC|nr:hypothetical protein THAOC_37011 [Thalassiosira oceanica]|eukprot:EJK44444.1 hypothetical protein THAOC_37011 [Thalassiosira oceanica]